MILFSGGLDSTLMLAKAKGKKILALTFDYGQRHSVEIKRARALTTLLQIPHQVIALDKSIFTGSALTNGKTLIKGRTLQEIREGGVPTSYVPARNSLFLAYALSIAEAHGAKEIHFGANLHDREGYPDCTPAFVHAFQALIDEGTTKKPRLVTPLIEMDKRAIWEEALKLNIPIELTWSCYDPQEEEACGSCDACVLRESSKPSKPIQSL